MNQKITFFALLTLSIFAVAYLSTHSQNDQFQNWKTKFGTPFFKSQEMYRRLIFQSNLKQIEAHNSDPTQSYKKGINQFTIYTLQEFKSLVLSDIVIPEHASKISTLNDQYTKEPNIDIDWTTKGDVSRVKLQGYCASAWAFSATGACQSLALIHGKHLQFSQQQLIDCSGAYGNQGCKGGFPFNGLKYIKQNGITSQTDYPYTAVTQTCKKKGGDFKISSIVPLDGCSGLHDGITTAPISVLVDASNWRDYQSGVFDKCQKRLNHAGVLVGVINGVWKFKNCWGPSWGQKGFIRLASGDTCGICLNGGYYPK